MLNKSRSITNCILNMSFKVFANCCENILFFVNKGIENKPKSEFFDIASYLARLPVFQIQNTSRVSIENRFGNPLRNNENPLAKHW